MHSHTHGDPMCHAVVETPAKLTAAQKGLLQELATIIRKGDSRHSPRANSWIDKVRESVAE